MKELADAAEELLREIGPSQERGTVAEYPNERTVRYYISEGLLPEPIGKAGSASIFGYEHLVTLVAIKKLQSEGLPINVIKGVIEGRSVEQLERLLDADEAGSDQAGPADLSLDLNEISFSNLSGPPSSAPAEPPQNPARSFLESLLFSRPSKHTDESLPSSPAGDDLEFSVPRSAAAMVGPAAESLAKRWERHEIEPGLELHVREDYSPVAGWRKALKAIERILRRASGK